MSTPTEQSVGPATQPEDWGYELLLYGNEQILRASDNGVLVAFAAIAFQEIRGDKLPHHNTGFSLLLFSVLLCAVVHFAIGNAYVGRAKRLIRRHKDAGRRSLTQWLYTTLTWVAGVGQLLCIVIGLCLVLMAEPPAFLRDSVLKWLE
jgi:hypothetical protein